MARLDNIEVDAATAAESLTVRVRINRYAFFMFRAYVGGLLVRLGAKIAGTGFEVEIE